jgi:hypothetical protein
MKVEATADVEVREEVRGLDLFGLSELGVQRPTYNRPHSETITPLRQSRTTRFYCITELATDETAGLMVHHLVGAVQLTESEQCTTVHRSCRNASWACLSVSRGAREMSGSVLLSR